MRSSFLSSHFSKGFCTDLFLIANAEYWNTFQILDFSLKKERPSPPHTGPPQKIKRRRRRRLPPDDGFEARRQQGQSCLLIQQCFFHVHRPTIFSRSYVHLKAANGQSSHGK